MKLTRKISACFFCLCLLLAREKSWPADDVNVATFMGELRKVGKTASCCSLLKRKLYDTTTLCVLFVFVSERFPAVLVQIVRFWLLLAFGKSWIRTIATLLPCLRAPGVSRGTRLKSCRPDSSFARYGLASFLGHSLSKHGLTYFYFRLPWFISFFCQFFRPTAGPNFAIPTATLACKLHRYVFSISLRGFVPKNAD